MSEDEIVTKRGVHPESPLSIENVRLTWAEVVACPTCKAPAGRRCVKAHLAEMTLYEKSIETDSTHNRRYWDALEAKARGGA